MSSYDDLHGAHSSFLNKRCLLSASIDISSFFNSLKYLLPRFLYYYPISTQWRKPRPPFPTSWVRLVTTTQPSTKPLLLL